MKKTLLLMVIGSFLVFLNTSGSHADSVQGEKWKEFLTKKVRVRGFVENITGLSIAKGDTNFSTSNRFIMNRLTFQPEFNVDFADSLKLFISWRLAKDARYNKEAGDRRRNTPPLEPLDNTFYDDTSFQPRELVLDYIPTGRLTIRSGRQFISWGETDGVRLLDVINPQDFSFASPALPNLFSLDETKIALWGFRLLYTIAPVSNTFLDFFVFPGYDKEKYRVDVSPPTAGRWRAHPETRVPFGRLFANPIGPAPVVIPSIERVFPEAGDNVKVGIRLVHSIGKFNVGLGFIWGYNPQSTDQVFNLVNTSLGPGGATIASLNLSNDRTSIFAGHFNYAASNFFGIPVKSAIRGEIAFYPSQPYNISEFPGPSGLLAGPSSKYPDGTVEKNTLRYSLGIDRTTFIPFLHPDDPWRPFRFSFQMFQRIILDHEDGIRFFSTAEKINKVSTTLTFRASTGYLGDTILPDFFAGYDPEGYWVVNPALSYVPPWHEEIKLTLTAAMYGGRNKFKSFGLFDEKDSVFLKIRYQFKLL